MTWHIEGCNLLLTLVFAPTPADIESTYVFACTCQEALGVLVDPADTVRLFEIIHRALKACPDALSPVYMSSVTLAIVGLGRQVLRQVASPPLDADRLLWSTEDRVERVLRRVLAWHQRSALTLGDIARSLGVSVRYLSESINRVTNCGFLDHLHVIRVLHAAVALVETNESVDSIAHYVGYVSAAHFTRQFHRLLHVTPTRFRTIARAHLHRAY